MRKVFLGAVTAAVLLSPFSLAAAQAAPSAPRAKAATAAPAASQQVEAPAGFCAPNIDNDNRVFCFLGGSPQGMGECTEILSVSKIVIYYRCGQRQGRPPTPIGCLNLNGDNEYTCLLTARPTGSCQATFSILGIVNGYHCSTGSGRILPHGKR